MKYTLKVFFYKGTHQKSSGIGKRLQKTSGIDSISQCRLKSFQLNVVISDEIIFLVNFKSIISFTKQFLTFHSNRLECGKTNFALGGIRTRMQEVLGSNPTEGKICFSHSTLLEWNVKNYFVKTNKIS